MLEKRNNKREEVKRGSYTIRKQKKRSEEKGSYTTTRK